jgi:hypothetical protein
MLMAQSVAIPSVEVQTIAKPREVDIINLHLLAGYRPTPVVRGRGGSGQKSLWDRMPGRATHRREIHQKRRPNITFSRR